MAKLHLLDASHNPKKARRPQAGGTEDSEKKKRVKEKHDLESQIRSMGGEKGDLDLLKGVRDEELVQGAQAEDPVLKKDVTDFLKSIAAGSSAPAQKDAKSQKGAQAKEPKSRTPKKEPKKERPTRKAEAHEKKHGAKEAPLPPSPTKDRVKLVFSPTAHWYNAIPPLPPQAKPVLAPSAAQVSSLNERARLLAAADAEAYQASAAFTGNSASDSHFLQTILSKGTLSDRLSALTLLVQASPVHNSKALETLKSMAERGRGKGGREEGLKAMRCVVDWWVGGGAPSRKLRYFRDQPLLHPGVTDEHLVGWYFEDWVKKYFFSILQILETYSLDPLPYVRTQSLSFIATLLREKPEQEQNLLRLLINKLGDTEKAVCSRASYHLLQVLQAHPAMKGVIVREVKALIFRPIASTSAAAQPTESKQHSYIRFGDDDDKPKAKSKDHGKGKNVGKSGTMERWNAHAWYYSAVTLNQAVLTSSDQDREVARTLIDLYFEMFREILGGTVHSSIVDEGGHTAQPETEAEGKKKKGKAKEVRGDAGFAEVEDANSRLVSAVLTGVNRALPFAKVDMGGGNDVFKKHIDTLFLITHTSTFNISLQALMLLLQISTALSGSMPSSSKSSEPSYAQVLAGRFYRSLYASLLDQRLSTSNKQAMYLNLLFKALKADTKLDRIKAFVRRFIQVLVVGISITGGVEFISGGLYLLGELFSAVPGLRAMLTVPASQETIDEVDAYDPRKRDPQYAHASVLPLYELAPLLHHYHPAVSLHAHQLLNSQPITATADLSLNTLSHFLDRFIYKNPKKPKTKGASAMQPAATIVDGTNGVKLVKGEVASGGVPVNDEKWWKRKEKDVPVDELFFHKYFTRKNEKEKAMKEKVKKRKSKGGETDEETDSSEDEHEDVDIGEDSDEEVEKEEESEGGSDDEDSDAEEAKIWKAMKATMPAELQDDDLSDSDASDDIPSGLDDSEGEDKHEDEHEDAAAVSSPAEHDKDSEDDEDEEDVFSLAEASDAEDLLSLDEEVPEGLIEYDGSDESASEAEEEEWGGIGGTTATSNKRKRNGKEDSKSRRKKLRSLPTFATYEDYAKLIEDGPEDNI